MSFRFVTIALLACAHFAFAASPEPASNPALSALFDREFQLGLQEFPEQATYLGIEGYNDRLHDASAQAVARRKAHVKSVLAELTAFDPAKLLAQDRISLSMMVYNLRRKDELNALYGELPFVRAAMAGCK